MSDGGAGGDIGGPVDGASTNPAGPDWAETLAVGGPQPAAGAVAPSPGAPGQDGSIAVLERPVAPPKSTAEQVNALVAAEARSRRLRFWGGALVIVLIGGLWAALSKDPPRDQVIFAEFGFDEPIMIPAPPPIAVEAMPFPVDQNGFPIDANGNPVPTPSVPGFAIPEVDFGDLVVPVGGSVSIDGFLGERSVATVALSAGQELTVTIENGEMVPGLNVSINGANESIGMFVNGPGTHEIGHVATQDESVLIVIEGGGPPIMYQATVRVGENG